MHLSELDFSGRLRFLIYILYYRIDIPLSYNCHVGRSALSQLSVRSHFATFAIFQKKSKKNANYFDSGGIFRNFAA